MTSTALNAYRARFMTSPPVVGTQPECGAACPRLPGPRFSHADTSAAIPPQSTAEHTKRSWLHGTDGSYVWFRFAQIDPFTVWTLLMLEKLTSYFHPSGSNLHRFFYNFFN